MQLVKEMPDEGRFMATWRLADGSIWAENFLIDAGKLWVHIDNEWVEACDTEDYRESFAPDTMFFI